jgi:cytochrome c oxidase assembly factor CtaG
MMMHEIGLVYEEPALITSWEFDPVVVIPLLITAVLYSAGLARLWRRAGAGRGVTYVHAALFAGGWLTLGCALVSPLHEYGEHLFLAHMVEHELLMAVAAPLLALSRPLGTFLHAFPRAWRLALVVWVRRRPIQATWSWLTNPLMATILHGLAIWIWHAPMLLDATLDSSLMHRLQHASFLITALFFWWAIIRLPAKEYGVGAAHVFATMMHTSLLGALLTLAPRICYARQTRDAALFGWTPLQDQQLAGLFMWVPGGAIYLIAGLWLVSQWLRAAGLRRPISNSAVAR